MNEEWAAQKKFAPKEIYLNDWRKGAELRIVIFVQPLIFSFFLSNHLSFPPHFLSAFTITAALHSSPVPEVSETGQKADIAKYTSI